ncbi:WecB/TagA/CpsF family glycosyltransferase [Belliella sp. R4-6]|uniref:WecB/TagA/CpsF family glycosyltransferase n=1 Tax=Belliella alkalica TaxID=1730871 RepID=A0ABS9VEM1_9BACT|nr:WecB/TagA/CpsF family glycosyltransferase [Belliella alkalica]MCH7414624.1 WecB/TagA/CpsF family glycosyltransferase [Belliella alkalica]
MIELLSYPIATEYPDLILENRTIINTINPHSYYVAKSDVEFRNALLESDVLLPDGIGIVYAASILKKVKIEKIAGFDIFLFLLEKLNKSGGSCFFLGASEQTLDLIQSKIKKEYPRIVVKSFSPPFKEVFSVEDNKTMIEEVNKLSPDVLFVGMTAPKQEKWVHKNKMEINAKVICSIGAVFDFYAGTVKRPSKFWINLGLEWLPRLLREPKRLWKRNLISTPIFIIDVIRNRFSNG